ncbi:MAG: DUF1524 domain-containing protein, partial [Crocinitomicaceae bacterium]|nr:DUF1524 domain-containing protein [Crocinitomicaceae bacterium]
RIPETWAGVSDFGLHQMNGKFVKHLLSRITSHLDNLVGKDTNYSTYHHPNGKQFEIEHIWANKFDQHRDEFDQLTDFQKWRNSIGALILLPQGTNQSFSSDRYEDKIEHYLKENTYAQTLHPTYYTKNPNFLKSEQITDNTIPAESISQNFGEKKSFDLFESAVEINPSAILDVNEDTNFVEEITFLENEITSNSEEKDVQPEFSWDIGVSNSDASESSTKIEEKEEIVRHMLEEEVIMELDSEVKHTTPEEQQKIAQERSFKIMEYTNKLKNAEGIADFENEPAYVRRNISLNQSIPSSEESVSRFGLSEEEDGKSGLRSNNFLHDNVD